MHRKNDVGWLRLLICIFFVAAAAFGGYAWLAGSDLTTSVFYNIGSAYVINMQIFFYALFIIDALYLLYRGVSSLRAKREERFLERYAQEYRLTHPENDEAKEGN